MSSMKRIYVAHSRDSDYQKELYDPLRSSELNSEFEIVLPHERSAKPFNSREELKTIDYVVAEVSQPATGLGIEIGWATMLGVPVVAVYKAGVKLSGSVKMLAATTIEYSTSEELIQKLGSYLAK